MIKFALTPECVLRVLTDNRSRRLLSEKDPEIAALNILDAEINCARIKLQAEQNAKKVVQQFLKK